MLPELYHAHHARHPEDLPFWLTLAQQAGDPVLELGCGTGRVLLPLAAAGYRTVGVDNDLSMLSFTRASLAAHIQPQPLLVAADISRFQLGAQFSLIIMPCNTFSTLAEAQRKTSLGCIRRHLDERGIFAASLPNPHYLKSLPARSETELEDEFTHPHTGNPVQVSSAWVRTRRSFSLTWVYDHLLPDGRVERTQVETCHWLEQPETYFEEFHRAGLEVSQTYGDFDGSHYDDASPHLILVANRQPY